MGGVGLLGTVLLVTQARLARRAVPVIAAAPLADGAYGDGDVERPPLRLAVLGDSGGAGVGCARPDETIGARLATALAAPPPAGIGRTVVLDVLAVSGSRSEDLDPQVSRALLTPPDVAVVVIGANDVTHFVPPPRAVAFLRAAVERLVAAGARVVVGTCPDLSTVPPIPQPLRVVAGARSRRMAEAQQAAVTAGGGVAVPLAALLAARFAAQPQRMFCADRFHPSAEGYRELAEALLPAVRAASGLADTDVDASASDASH